ncbi:HAD-IIB family hydrolase [Psychrobacillus sp. NPDC093180]|uniref:HAD-IIB family hydrolase n=1 Tax=Psychrobacillus sp. NPDC093180 TaxID=3364489 RepID=UPI0038202B95
MKEKAFVLATDLDGTLVGDNTALHTLLSYYEESSLDIAIIYITGRHLASSLSLITEENLPQPDILITDVGTAIYTSQSLTEEALWTEKMQSDWYPQKIIRIAENFPLLKRQVLPTDNRISFTVHQNEEVVREFKQALCEENLPHKLIFSSNRDVDILPPNSGKGEALLYVLQNYFHKEVQVLVAGDSGNDVEMLSLGYPSVIVGNAQRELIDMTSHPLLYRASKHFAGGIHEAWLHFFNKKNQPEM